MYSLNKMGDFEKLQCGLCLGIVNDEDCREIDDVTRNILNVLVQQNFNGKSKHVMCNICSQKMMEAFIFKSMCLYTNNTIVPYMDDEKGCSVDLREIYVKEKGREQFMDTLDYKVCRLCMQIIEGEFISVREMRADMTAKYIPEMKFNIVTDPVVCRQCFDSFDTHSSFIKNCLEKIKDLSVIGSHGSVSWEPSLDPCIETEAIYIKSEEKEPLSELVKTECTIKVEDKKVSIKMEHDETKLEDKDSNSTPEVSFHETERKYIPETNSLPKQNLIKQKEMMLNHFMSLECRCDYIHCNCKTTAEGGLKKHRLKLKDPSKQRTYKCDLCNYESKNKQTFTSHQLVHKDPTEVPMYTCDSCDFISKHKKALRRHQLQHANLSEVKMYKCDLCDFKTKYRNNLKDHLLLHMDPSKVRMYKCGLCDYISKFSNSVKVHSLKHADDSQVRMYKCSLCDFTSKYKSSLYNHRLNANHSEKKIYKCQLCDFQTKCEKNLKYHNSIHANYRFNDHKLEHEDPLSSN